MKKNILIAIFIASTFTVFAQQDSDKPYQSKSLANENIQMVESKTTGGNITMMGVSQSESKIELYIQPNNGRDRSISREEIQKRFNQDYELTVAISNHKLTAIAKAKNSFTNWNRGLSISFKIWVGKNASSDLQTSGGNIIIKDLSGDEHFTTSGGNIGVENLTGKIKGHTSGGNIYVKNSSNVIELATSGGNISANNSSGDMNLSTSGGDVILEYLKGTIKAKTSGGNIKANNIEGSLVTGTSGGNVKLYDMACSLEAGTSGGNITVSMNKMGQFIKLHNSGGSIDLELPQNAAVNLMAHASRVKLHSMQTFKGSFDEHNIDGTLNGGGVPVKLDGGDHISVTVK